jgi:hypothetical protein
MKAANVSMKAMALNESGQYSYRNISVANEESENEMKAAIEMAAKADNGISIEEMASMKLMAASASS